MIDDHASATALGVTVIRAVHQIIDATPHILEDPVSPMLLDMETLQNITADPGKHMSPAARGLRSHVVLRSRFAEDKLHLSVRAGMKQYVSLGAGYDTFCCRQPDWARSITIVEIDHPATQSAKIERFTLKGFEFPVNVDFLPLDFEEGNLIEELSHSKIDPALPAFISCLGVFAYLKPETVGGLFRCIATMARGTILAFAFAPRVVEAILNAEDSMSASKKASEHGEPWLTRFEVEELREELMKCGFSKVSFLEISEASAQYYAGRKDLPGPRAIRLCEAVV